MDYVVSSGCCPDTGPGTSPAAKIGNIADKLLYLPDMKRILRNIFSSVLLLAVLACTKDGDFGIGGTGSDRRGPGVKVVPKTGERRVLLAYSAGFNNLSADLEDDIDELKTGWIPAKNSPSVLLVLFGEDSGPSHTPVSRYGWRCGFGYAQDLARGYCRSLRFHPR